MAEDVRFKDEDGLPAHERSAHNAARTATGASAAAGVVGVGAATVAIGASGPAIIATLTTIGGAVGGGALAGTAVLAAAPVALAAGTGYGTYLLWGRQEAQMTTEGSDHGRQKTL